MKPTSEHNFKPGDKVRAQGSDGTATYVADDTYRACIIVRRPDHTLESWCTDLTDLVPEPFRLSGWVNVYGDGTDNLYNLAVHPTRKVADKNAHEMIRDVPEYRRRACVYITGTEGVEPDETDT